MHSPLGGSVASRFINCPGSMNLIASVPEAPDDPLMEEYRETGTAAHKLASLCLQHDKDAWELAELDVGCLLNADDLIAVQVYLDYCRSLTGERFFEEAVGLPELNQHLHGTLDYAVINDALLEIVDYKHGVGVVVDAENNFQLLYYAFCKLMKTRGINRVKMTIVQPRAHHWSGPVRSWEVDAHEVFQWGEKTLLPAMQEAEISTTRIPGNWCQFCSAKLYCPEALAVFDEGRTHGSNPEVLSDERLAERFASIQVVMFVKKAIEQEVLKRALKGAQLPGVKLVQQKADRIWKDGAELIFKDKPDAWTDPELKSPAKVEKITGLSSLVPHWAYKPATGYVAAREDDRRHAVKLPSASDAFQQYATEEPA